MSAWIESVAKGRVKEFVTKLIFINKSQQVLPLSSYLQVRIHWIVSLHVYVPTESGSEGIVLMCIQV